MNTRFSTLWIATLLAVAGGVRMEGAVDPTEWPRQLAVDVPRSGLTRLELTVPVLAWTRPGRQDLLLLDPGGQEVPWRLRRALVTEPSPGIRTAGPITARIEDRRTILEFETGTDRQLAGLSLVTSAGGFFKPVEVDGWREGAWERLVSGVPIYRDYQGATDLRLDVAPGVWSRFRLVLDDRRSPPIPVSGVLLIASPATPAPVATLPVVLRARTEEPGVSRLQLDLGAAGLDVAWIELETPEPVFTRPVRLLAERVAGDALESEELVRAVVHRIPGDAALGEGNRRIRVERTLPTREVLLRVENGDSPPLAVSSVRVGWYPQHVEFWAPTTGVYRLLAGHAFVQAPRYDLSRLALPAELEALNVVVQGTWEPNPGYREPAVGPDALALGAAFEPKGWRHRRGLTVAAGAAELELPGDVMGEARPDLADLRLVRAGRQVPYVADRQIVRRRLGVAVTAEAGRRGSNVSTWRVETDGSGAPPVLLRLDTSQAAFARGLRWVEVVEAREGSRRTNVLAATEWVRKPGQVSRPLELAPAFPPAGRTTWIEIDDGDNPPLPGLTATAEYATRRVLFLAPDGEPMDVYYGNPKAESPRYDLALIADRLNASSRSVAVLGPAEERARGWGETVSSGPVMKVVFWGVLGGVVVALLAVIRRLLPATPPTEGGSGGP